MSTAQVTSAHREASLLARAAQKSFLGFVSSGDLTFSEIFRLCDTSPSLGAIRVHRVVRAFIRINIAYPTRAHVAEAMHAASIEWDKRMRGLGPVQREKLVWELEGSRRWQRR